MTHLFDSKFIALLKREWLSSSRALGTFVLIVCGTAAVFFITAPAMASTSVMNMGNVSQFLLYAQYRSMLMFVAGLTLPALGVQSMHVEWRQGNFDMLRTTLLTPGQIVAAKIFSALFVFLLIFIATLPIVGALFFISGVDWKQFLLVAVNLLVFALLASSVGIASGIKHPRRREAVSAAYGGLIALLFLSSIVTNIVPIGLMFMPSFPSYFIFLRGMLSSVPYLLICLVLYRYSHRTVGYRLRVGVPELAEAEPKVKAFKKRTMSEVFFAPITFNRINGYLVALPPLLAGSIGGIMWYAQSEQDLVVWPIFFSVPILLLAVGNIAMECVREREQETLDLLRMTLYRPWEHVRRQQKEVFRALKPALGAAFMGICILTAILLLPNSNGRIVPILTALSFFAVSIGSILAMIWIAVAAAQCVALLARGTAQALLHAFGLVGAWYLAPALGLWPGQGDWWWVAWPGAPLAALFSQTRLNVLHVPGMEWVCAMGVTLFLAVFFTVLAVPLYKRYQGRDR
jgi:hypothetical protein